MDHDLTILLIDEDSAAIDSIRRVLGVGDHAERFKLRRVPDVSTALARIRGGGIDVVLLTLQAIAAPTEKTLAPFLEFQEKALGVPVVVLGDDDAQGFAQEGPAQEDLVQEGLAHAAIAQGAAGYLLRGALAPDLLQMLRLVARKAAGPSALLRTLAPSGKGGKIITFMGAKGGAGTTTVALNVAAALARHWHVILVELHAELGSLALYFQPHRSARGIGDLLAAADRAQEIPLRELDSCLWPVKNVPGLQVLYGARSQQSSTPLDPANAAGILALASEIADYVIVDLPASLSETNRAVLENSACLALVVERDPISVQSAKLILSRVDSWKAGKLTIGDVILNRAALVSPMPFAEIDAELRIRTLGVVPPAPDLCAAAQNARSPMVTLDPESLASVALRDLAREIEDLVPAARPTERTADGPLGAYQASQKMIRAGLG
jgi:Flp pilus assembly CpaE family ATPase